MHLNLQIQGLAETQRRIAQVPRQARFAASQALNGAGGALASDWRAEIGRVFDRPTPYITNSVRVQQYATRENLRVLVGPGFRAAAPGGTGGKGVDPDKVLLAEVFGGPRRPKRFEVALRRAGILPNNMAAVPASWVVTDPASADGFGGVNGPFIRRVLSYLQAFSEVGSYGNMKERARARLSGRGRWVNGRFYGAHTKVGASGKGAAAVRQGGVEYFVSRGRGEFTGRGSWKRGQQQHLRAGIWQRTGLYGADVKPVFLFTRMPRYRQRLNLQALAERAMGVHFPPLFEAAFRRAMETAR